MRIAAKYSHMNGEEFLLIRREKLWREISDLIESIDATDHRTKAPRENKTKRGALSYSPTSMDQAFKERLKHFGWKPERISWATQNEQMLRDAPHMFPDEQIKAITTVGPEPILSYNQTDFVKSRIAVEVRFGKYSSVAHDLFAKHLGFFILDAIDVGIEILPMKELEAQMPSGTPYFERSLQNILKQGRGVPAVPLVLVGVAP